MERRFGGAFARRATWTENAHLSVGSMPQSSSDRVRCRHCERRGRVVRKHARHRRQVANVAFHQPEEGADASRFVVIEYRSHITILVAIQRLQHSTEVLRLRRTRTIACRCSSLREGESQQARAQQHKAGCGQREESVGDQIVIAHDTPATLDARPNLLKLSEHASWKEVMRLSAFGAQTIQGSRPMTHAP
jgi:hypothetical protein